MKNLPLSKYFYRLYSIIKPVQRFLLIILCLVYLLVFYGTRAVRSIDMYNDSVKKTYGFSEFNDLMDKHLVGTSYFWRLLKAKEILVAGYPVSERTYERFYLLSWFIGACFLWLLMTSIKATTLTKIGTIGFLAFGAIVFEKLDQNNSAEVAVRRDIHTIENSVSEIQDKLDEDLESIFHKIDNLEYECSRTRNIQITTY